MIKLKHLFILCAISTSVAAQNIDSISATYKMSENAIVRKDALKELSKKPENSGARSNRVAAPGNTNAPSNTNNEKAALLIREALNDPNPTVVEEAIVQAGELKLQGFSENFYQLYFKKSKNFGGYHERIQCAILISAGKIADNTSKKLLLEVLAKDNGDALSSILLSAINQMNDESTVEPLIQYAEKLEQIVKTSQQAGVNALLYSGAKISAESARAIADSILNKKAGN